jgi:hypothetical protein
MWPPFAKRLRIIMAAFSLSLLVQVPVKLQKTSNIQSTIMVINKFIEFIDTLGATAFADSAVEHSFF